MKAEIKLPESTDVIGKPAFGFIDKDRDYYCKKAVVTGDPCDYLKNKVGEYK